MPCSKIFCPLPWSAMAIQPHAVTLCCASFVDLHKEGDTLLQTFHGDRMRAVREQFLRSEWPAECENCQKREASGADSLRQKWCRAEVYQDTVSRQESLSSEPEPLVFLELAGSNVCNLKCRMCRPLFSTKWQEDVASLRQHPELLGEWFYYSGKPPDELVLDPAADEFRALRVLMLKGGEPMLNKNHFEFLNGLVDCGRAGRIVLRITTNGTVLPAGFLGLVGQFKKSEINVSIDGVDPLFQYIRSGSFTTADIKHNIDLLKRAGASINIITAYQTYNMLGYARLIEEFRSLTRSFSTTFVTTWALSAATAPDPLRQKALEQLRQIPREGLPSWTCAGFERLVRRMERGQYDPVKWKQFKQFTHTLDRIRGESICSAAPEIADFFSECE
jgi:MoaA/NifB/PqqE/SkfB family radical SAM enzyme